MSADFRDAGKFLLGWSVPFGALDSFKIASHITSLPVANNDPDVETVIWYRILPFVPRASWERYFNHQNRTCYLDVHCGKRAFDTSIIIEWLKRTAEYCCIEIAFSMGSRLRGKLHISLGKEGKFFLCVGEAGDYTGNADFYEPLVRTFLLDKFATFKRGPNKERPDVESLYYTITDRRPEGFELFELGFDRDAESGLLVDSRFYINKESDLHAYLRMLETSNSLTSLEVVEAGLTHLPYRQWEDARQSLQVFEPRECVLSICNKDSYKWDPANLAKEMAENDLITLGYLGGPGLPKGADIPRFLRERLLSVDLVREGEGWAFCLTSLERELTDSYRQRINEYLNEQLGFQFITRGVKERWGKLLMKRK